MTRRRPASPSKRGRLARALVHSLRAYVPGEQPRIKGLIKLNTNENPYPPAPAVLRAIRAAVDDRLRLYPNPTAQLLRRRLARLHRCAPANIIVGNGSDELLALAVRTFVEPEASPREESWRPDGNGLEARRSRRSQSTVQFFTPSYSLYPVLAAIHGARANAVRLTADFGLPALRLLQRSKAWDFQAALSFITTPNAPSGRPLPLPELEALCRRQRGVVLLDEAYVDFADANASALALKHPHVLVARTFSKAYSLCFLRVGYLLGHPGLIAALDKLRDSYNVNGLAQVGALATLENLGYYRANFDRIRNTRRRLGEQLSKLGFQVLPSQTNFILVRPPRLPARVWLTKLRARRILVRWFSYPEVKDYLRITVGTDAEAEALVSAVEKILGARR